MSRVDRCTLVALTVNHGNPIPRLNLLGITARSTLPYDTRGAEHQAPTIQQTSIVTKAASPSRSHKKSDDSLLPVHRERYDVVTDALVEFVPRASETEPAKARILLARLQPVSCSSRRRRPSKCRPSASSMRVVELMNMPFYLTLLEVIYICSRWIQYREIGLCIAL